MSENYVANRINEQKLTNLYDIIEAQRNRLILQDELIMSLKSDEKPREWWTVGERYPMADKTLLVWIDGVWEKAYFMENLWLSGNDSSTIRPIYISDIWRLMPEAPVIGERKS